ncbi:pilin [Patescibacteria group bacterium]
MLKYHETICILVVFIAISGVVVFPLAGQALTNAVELEVGFSGNTTAYSITGYIRMIYLFASGIVGGLAAVMIVIGAIQYSTAAGSPKGIASAKETIISAIVGLVIVGVAYLILGTFGTQFTDLKEPELPVVSYFGNPDTTPYIPPSQDNLICVDKGNGEGPKCQLNAGGTQYDPDCRSIGQSCDTATPPPPVKDCPKRTQSECENNGEIDCRWCLKPRGCVATSSYHIYCPGGPAN